MTKQEMISALLENAIANKLSKDFIGDLKFLKSELQRGKTKELSDNDTINILITLIRKQNEMVDFLEVGSADYISNRAFVSRIEYFLDKKILDQIYVTEVQLRIWIQSHVNMNTINNKNQIIGVVKKSFPYIDGNLIKKVLETI